MSTEGTEGGTSGGGPGTRRRRSPLVVASVAAAVLLAGGGAAYWASTASEGGGAPAPAAGGNSSTPPPLALDGYGARTGSGGPSQGIAPGEPDPHGVLYRAAGTLPDGPRTAAVRLPAREVTADQVAALAEALGISGTPRLNGDTWTVGGTPDAAGPTLQVGRQGPGSWAYTRYGVPGGAHCEHPPGAGPRQEPEGPGAKCPSFKDGSPPPPDPAAAQPVSQDTARKAAAPVLKALGQEGARTDASKVFGALRTVTADPVVGSLPTYGWQTTLQVGADGKVASGNGQLQLPPAGATYPLVTARQALDELNKGAGTGRPTTGGCATAVPFREDAPTPDAGCSTPPGRGPEPATVRGATFALSAQSVGGRPALVPSWLFAVEMPGMPKGDTITVAQPAVDPKFIAGRGGGSAAPSGTPTSPPAKSGPVRVESYTPADGGRKLVLHFWGGVCSTFAASAEQSERAVTVKVTATEKEPGRYCVLMLKRFDTTVSLDEPLGDRSVVDLATGAKVNALQEK
ncbi:hypothetical protein [Streptomyces sp. NPDC049555]|uniref:hypothetical protein n=1 Tax=unclassified Streptomyces TaxID=2593676 RepID=UPI00341CAF6A